MLAIIPLHMKRNNQNSRWYRQRKVMIPSRSSKAKYEKTNVKVKEHSNEKFLDLPKTTY